MSRRRIHFLSLALALLAAQALALLHGFVHLPGPLPGGVAWRATPPACASQAGPLSSVAHAAQPDGLASLFGAHADDADCRLLDQLADAGPPAVSWNPVALPVAGVWTARWRDAALRVLRPAPPGRGPPAIA